MKVLRMSVNLIAKASVTINAPSRKVWEALVNPEAIKQYMFGTTVVSYWREGGSIVWNRILQYSHFSPLSGVPDTPENYHTVTIELSGAQNQTLLSLAQDHNSTEEERDHSAKNWEMMLTALKKFLEG